MPKYTDEQLRFHHTRCHRNRESIQASKRAGCFWCLEIFPASEVTAYIDHPPSGDAHCPKCGIDSVIADDEVNEFSPELLRALKQQYFEKKPKPFIRTISKEMQDEIDLLAKQFEASLADFQPEN